MPAHAFKYTTYTPSFTRAARSAAPRCGHCHQAASFHAQPTPHGRRGDADMRLFFEVAWVANTANMLLFAAYTARAGRAHGAHTVSAAYAESGQLATALHAAVTTANIAGYVVLSDYFGASEEEVRATLAATAVHAASMLAASCAPESSRWHALGATAAFASVCTIHTLLTGSAPTACDAYRYSAYALVSATLALAVAYAAGAPGGNGWRFGAFCVVEHAAVFAVGVANALLFRCALAAQRSAAPWTLSL